MMANRNKGMHPAVAVAIGAAAGAITTGAAIALSDQNRWEDLKQKARELKEGALDKAAQLKHRVSEGGMVTQVSRGLKGGERRMAKKKGKRR